MDAWQPIKRSELDELLAKQTAELSAESRKRYARYRIEPRQATYRRSEQYKDEGVWVVAQADDFVVFFDDVEDEFAVGRVDEADRLYHVDLLGELTDALFEFPERYGGRRAT
jgi:hypothetical protein